MDDTTKQRLLKGATYFINLKPSEYAAFGVPHPVRIRELKAYMQLVIDSIADKNDKLDLLIKEHLEVKD